MRGAVAIVEDDAVVRRNLCAGFTAADFQVVWSAGDGASALAAAEANTSPVGALVVDLGLPDVDGLDLLSGLRSRSVTAPALALTARSRLEDRLTGFSAGFDDYLGKPFAFDELIARVEVLLRRAPEPATSGLHLDPLRHELRGACGAVALTPLEYRLLAILLNRPGAVVRRQSLTAAAWPAGAIVRDNTLDAYIARLRRQLRAVSPDSSLETVRRVGYRLT